MSENKYPAGCIPSHVDQEEECSNYDGPWGDGPSRWTYWYDKMAHEWCGRTTPERHGEGDMHSFGKFHPLTGESVDDYRRKMLLKESTLDDVVGMVLVDAKDTPVPGSEKTILHLYFSEKVGKPSHLVNYHCWVKHGSSPWLQTKRMIGARLTAIEESRDSVHLQFGPFITLHLPQYIGY